MMPNFLVIGAARSGTTSLHHYMKAHPEIFMSSVKEPNFFGFHNGQIDLGYDAPGWRSWSRRSTPELEKYHALFREVKEEKAIGEVSPMYMRSPGAAERIRRAIPDARLIAILRDPAERAYANYMGRLRDGTEKNPDPRDALEAAICGRGSGWRKEVYIDLGSYHERLRPFYERFDRDRIRVVLFDDFIRDRRAVLRELFAFLEVDPGFEPDTSIAYNSSGRIRNPLLRFAWTNSNTLRARVQPWLPRPLREAGWALVQRNLSRPPLPPDLRARLVEWYRPDILALEELLDRDLSAWRA
jgi:hypothetical protein